MKTRCFLLLLIVILFLVGCNRAEMPANLADAATAVAAESNVTPTPRPTRPAPSGTTVLADGQLAAANPALALGFQANGRLLAIHVQPGDVVNEGDLIAELDDAGLQDGVTNAEMQAAQAENNLAQAQLSLDDLLNWEADETAVAVAEANLAAAEAGLGQAENQDAAAGNSLTSARINLEQAQRNLADAQKAYDTAFDPGREWELYVTDPFCFPGQDGGTIPCTGAPYNLRMEAEREGATRGLEFAQENLEVAQAQYNLAAAGLNRDTAVSAAANLANAQQALEQAQRAPRQSEIDAARLRVEQAALALEQSEFALAQAQKALADAQLLAPWSGTVLTVEAAPGGMIGAGAPIITLLDTASLQFHTSNLSERDLAQIQPGQPAEITLKAFPNDPVSGTVARIAPQASGVVGDAAVFTVMIDLDSANLELRPGMTGRVEITNEGGG